MGIYNQPLDGYIPTNFCTYKILQFPIHQFNSLADYPFLFNLRLLQRMFVSILYDRRGLSKHSRTEPRCGDVLTTNQNELQRVPIRHHLVHLHTVLHKAQSTSRKLAILKETT